VKEILPYIITRLKKAKVKYEVHWFDSGATMIDIWVNNYFYVIQLDDDEIGLSLVTEKTLLFDNKPDSVFKDQETFKIELEKIPQLD